MEHPSGSSPFPERADPQRGSPAPKGRAGDPGGGAARELGARGGGLRRRRQRHRRHDDHGGRRSRCSTTTAAGGATTTTTAAAPQPTTLEAWEALWKQQRAAIVKRIKDNNWGKSADGTKVTGPEGYTIDLTKCPAGWSDTEGLTDTRSRSASASPRPGRWPSTTTTPIGIRGVFDYYSEQGAFKDVNGKTRKINFIVKDDGYDPARTIPIVDEFLDSEKVFAVWTAGSPSTLKTYDKINQRCVAQPDGRSPATRPGVTR